MTERSPSLLLDDLREWARTEFRHRTEMLGAGYGRIEWIDPGTRVSFSEITAKADELGLVMNVVDLRRAMEGVLD